MDTDTITTVIVDDEELARKRLSRLLKKYNEISLVAACENGGEAVASINKHRPMLIFLDIQMPEMDGFEVLEQLDITDYYPSIIFVTAYDEYALRAFDVHALDYLLKPFEEDKFHASLRRAIDLIRQSQSQHIWEKLEGLAQAIDPSENHLTRIMIKTADRFFFLPVEEIDWISAAGNYVRIHSGENSYLIRNTMANMEKKLDPDRFFRVHRSSIVNVDKVREIEQWFHGDYRIVMVDDTKIMLSRNYKDLLQRF